MEKLLYITAIMTSLGIPSIFALVSWSVKQIKQIRKDNKEREKKQAEEFALVKEGLQMDLKLKLDDMYYAHENDTHITEEALTRWNKAYAVYHKLFENGIMTKKNEFMTNLDIKK